MITLTNIILVSLSAVLIPMTIKGSPYRSRAWLLFAEFCAFIGFAVIASSYHDGLWFDIISMLGSTVFMALFALIGAMYLSYISGAIALYHVSTMGAMMLGNSDYLDYYYPVMLGFCALQLGGLIPGVVHGVRRYLYRNILTDRRHISRYHYNH